MAEKKEKYNILDKLSDCSGYDIALMTSFNYDINFFERKILNRLYSKNLKKISVFVDAKEFVKSINRFDINKNVCYIGRKYMINPVQMNGAFHPKLILLLGKNKARLLVGSANITNRGFERNNEIFNFFDYSSSNSNNLGIIVEAINFFKSINDISYKLDNEILELAQKYKYYLDYIDSDTHDIALINNIDKAIIFQISKLIPSDIKSISIAVPYYDNKIFALKKLKGLYPNAIINLYVQNRVSTFPIEQYNENEIAARINVFSGFKDNSSNTSDNFYHGKVFLFKTEERDYILYGSANCTVSALVKSYRDNGNIECDILESGEPDSFDYFFDNMKLDNPEDFISNKLEKNEDGCANYYYKYGEVKNRIELHFGFIEKRENISVKINDSLFEHYYSDDELIVYVSEENQDMFAYVINSNVFEAYIINKEDESDVEKLRCWTIIPYELSVNRDDQIKKINYDYEDLLNETIGEKYCEQIIHFLDSELTSFSELYEEKNEQINRTNQKLEQMIELEDNNGGIDDYIVDVSLFDNDMPINRGKLLNKKIRYKFFSNVFGKYGKNSNNSEKQAVNSKDYINEDNIIEEKRTYINNSNSYKRLCRYLKKNIIGMLDVSYINAIEIERYIELVAVIFDILDLIDVDNNEKYISHKFVVETKISFLKAIIYKWSQNPVVSDELPQVIICKCFEVLLSNYLYYREVNNHEEKAEYKKLNKNLLKQLENTYKIRNTYMNYIEIINKSNSKLLSKLNSHSIENAIEEMFGYKDYDELCKFIKSKYIGAAVSISGNTFKICITTDSIGDYMHPIKEVIREIDNYSCNVSRINYVNISAKNICSSVDNKRIDMIYHSISLGDHKWNWKYKYRNGIEFKKTEILDY